MQKLIGEIYHSLGSIKEKFNLFIVNEEDERKEKDLRELEHDIDALRWLIATNLTGKGES